MTIRRKINGKEYEFELTDNEKRYAFYEVQAQYYKEDIMHVYFNDEPEYELMQRGGLSKEQFDEMMDEMVDALEEELEYAEYDYLHDCIGRACDGIYDAYGPWLKHS